MKNTGPRRPDIRCRTVPGWLSAILVGGTLVALFILELRQPLRCRSTEPKLRRNVRNFAVAGISAVSIHLAERPVVRPLARRVERQRLGLLKRFHLPGSRSDWAVVLMDYTLYLWHVATHKGKRSSGVSTRCTTSISIWMRPPH